VAGATRGGTSATKRVRPAPGWESVLAAASVLPEFEESTSYGTAALKVRGKLFARLREDGETLVVRVGDEREALVLAAPGTFFITPHYEKYPWVLVNLAAIQAADLRDVLTAAWLLQAPKRLAAHFHAARAT
jgi:hypothetical protein